MADRYWVGGTAAWDGTAGSKWSESSGGAGGASVPTSVDDVFFTDLSTGTCTISAGVTGAKSIDCTGFTGTITGNTGITVSGSVTLVAGMTFTPTATWTISGTGTIISAGKTFNALTINGAGITVSLGDNLLIFNALNVTQGTFDTTASNYSITASGIISSNSNARTILLNGSIVNLTSTSTIINFSTVTNLTFNAGTSQINCTTVSGFVSILSGGVTFYNVSLPPSSSLASNHTITGANIFNNLTIFSPASAGASSCSFDANTTINGTLTCAGATAIRRVSLRSSFIGLARTLTVATLSAQDCDFRDVTVAGAAAGSSPTRAGDCGNNSGIVFPAAKTVYWNLAGAGANISSTGWALTSNGTPDINNFPLAQDTAAFTDSGSAGTITFTGGFNIGTVDASDRTTAATLNFSGTVTFYGSFTLGSGITVSGTNTQTFSGTGTMLFTSAGKTISFDPRIETATGTFRLGDALNSTDTLNFVIGTFDTNNYDVTIVQFASQAANIRTLILGTSTINLTGNGSVWNLSTATNLTFSGASSTINLTNQTSVARSFSGSGLTYGTLNIGGALGTSTLTISNSGGTFATLSSTKTVAHTITFTALCTITNWTVTGTAGNVVTVNSSPADTLRAITPGSSQINLDYMSFQDIYFNYTLNDSNPYRVYAGANSINAGNNLGIAFIDGTTKKAYLLTSGTTWTVPVDWNSSNNNIYLIGAGGGGATAAVSGNNRAAGGGGGGGGYTALSNQSLTPSAVIPYTIGTSAGNTNGGSTTFNTTNIAGGGLAGTATTAPTSTGGAGGTGDFAGGIGGAGAFGTIASTGYGAGGGGGAGGPNGVGGNGGAGFGSLVAANTAGGGGGGNSGGTAGGNASSATQGNGGNNFSGAGGATTNGGTGTFGGGGAGGVNTTTNGRGGSGIDIQNTIGGAGGAGGIGGAGNAGINTGLYGGGGSGGRVTTAGTTSGGAAGSQGVIFIVYSLGAAPASTPVVLSGVTISGGITIV
jgi:hypothetical protein